MRARLVAGTLVLVSLCGCLSVGGKEAPAFDRVHAVDLRRTADTPAAAGAPVLAVYPFQATGRFDLKLLRRDPDGRYSVFDTERWAETPHDAATFAAEELLGACGLFASVVPANSGLQAERALYGVIERFHVEAPATGPWRAVFRVRLVLAEDKSSRVLSSAAYESSTDLPGASMKGLGPAMSESVTKAFASAVEDWRRGGKIGSVSGSAAAGAGVQR